MATPTRPEFDEFETGLLQSLVRMELRRHDKKLQTGQRKWGREYDMVRHAEKTQILESIYEKLGGDPTHITVAEQ